MDKEINIILIEYLETLKNKGFEIESAYLFGSFAKGKQNKWSDIDIALIFNKFNKNRIDLQIELAFIASQIDSRIEPHPFLINDFLPNNYFSAEIIKTGIEIKKHGVLQF